MERSPAVILATGTGGCSDDARDDRATTDS